MAVKRDYGSFSKAASKLLAPLVAPFGFSPTIGASLSRVHDGWLDSFFLQQTAYGYGDFCVNVGIAVPKLNEYWQVESSIGGMVIAWRLSDKATEHGGDCWYHAKNKEQLRTSLERVAGNLEKALPWFDQFKNLCDVTEGFRSRSGVSARSEDYATDANATFAMNYGFLLSLSGNAREALNWLAVAHARATMPLYWDPVKRILLIAAQPGAKPVRPTEEDRKRVSIIEAAMKRLESSG